MRVKLIALWFYQQGAIPASIAVLKGRVHIGLDEQSLETLAKSRDAVKVSRRDLPRIMAFKGTGGTTVSATMLLAHKVNIPVFVTGGIGL